MMRLLHCHSNFLFINFRFKKYLESSKEELFEMGFPKFTTEDFHDMVRWVVSVMLFIIIILTD